jgi:hypothetical protein
MYYKLDLAQKALSLSITRFYVQNYLNIAILVGPEIHFPPKKIIANKKIMKKIIANTLNF